MKAMFKNHWIMIVGAAWTIVLAVFVASLFIQLPEKDFQQQSVQSLKIVDRHGIVLREYLNDRQGRGEWKTLSSIAPALQQATIAVEDKRFYSHPGIDPIAIGRSLINNITSMSYRSGGSTLSQQVIRSVYPHPRSLAAKMWEMWYALRLERMSSKEKILEQYLNRAPYGNQLFGVEAASRWYFGKPSKNLSLAESAFLAALPNAPSTLNPNRNIQPALHRQRDVLRRMLSQKIISQEDFDRAIGQPIQIIPPESICKAPHVADMVETLLGPSAEGTITTTIDYPLQSQVRSLMTGHVKKLEQKNVHNAAAIVIENRTGAIRALIGSIDFFDTLNNGQVNGVTALRQPGSAIKPFMYALTLMHGSTPATLFPDIPTAIPDHHGDYVPENYDRHYHGPVRLRTALACSYNVPAVRALQTIGKTALLEKLKEAGFTSLEKDAEFYGYGLTLGNAEVSLLELTTAYLSFAHAGMWKPAYLLPSMAGSNSEHRVVDEQIAYLITDILKDDVARRPAFGNNFHFPFSCAVKTGTTKDYKDNWTIGYTTQYTVGVWVGNFNGKEMRRVSGVSGAGPIFTDIMTFLHTPPNGRPPENFPVPAHLVRKKICAKSGMVPNTFCTKTLDEWFLESNLPKEPCTVHQQYLVQSGSAGVQKKIFELYPREYESWVRHEKIPVPPPDASLSREHQQKPSHEIKRLMIVSPNSGDYFKIDPVLREEYQKILIAGFIPGTVSDVRLKINDNVEIPFHEEGVSWNLKKGTYRFQLIGDAGNRKEYSTPVIINVE
jgi:penicillin-binding protein 1C